MSGKEIDIQKKKEDWLTEFSNQRADLFYPESWNDEQKQEVAEIVRPTRMKTAMFSSIPMTCQGKKCPVASVCPLLAKNLAPLGKPCPIELEAVKVFMVGIMDELHVDPDNLIEVSMVRDLVDQEIQYMRASKKLSMEDFIQEDVIGINEHTGEPIFKKNMHIAVELQDRILKRRKDLRNQLMATREQKHKIGQGHIDSAQAVSNVFSQLREITIQSEKLTRQKLGMEDYDDYIEDAVVVENLPEEDK